MWHAAINSKRLRILSCYFFTLSGLASANDGFKIPFNKTTSLIDESSSSFHSLIKPAPQNVVEGLLWTDENDDSGYPLEKILWFRSASKKLILIINSSENALDWRFFTESGKFIGAINTGAREDDLKSSMCMGGLKNDGVMYVYGFGISSGGRLQIRPLDQSLDGVGGVTQPSWLVDDESIKFSILGQTDVDGIKSVGDIDQVGVIEIKVDGLHLLNNKNIRQLAEKSLTNDCQK